MQTHAGAYISIFLSLLWCVQHILSAAVQMPSNLQTENASALYKGRWKIGWYPIPVPSPVPYLQFAPCSFCTSRMINTWPHVGVVRCFWSWSDRGRLIFQLWRPTGELQVLGNTCKLWIDNCWRAESVNNHSTKQYCHAYRIHRTRCSTSGVWKGGSLQHAPYLELRLGSQPVSLWLSKKTAHDDVKLPVSLWLAKFCFDFLVEYREVW